MPFSGFLRTLLSCTIVFCSVVVFAQTETLATSGNEDLIENSPKKIGDHLLYITKSSYRYKILDVNLSNGAVSMLDSNILKFGDYAYSSEGLFYTSFTQTGSWNDGDFYINFIDPTGNQLTPILIGVSNSSIPDNYEPRHATMCNNRYYVNSFYNNEHCIWESDGTTAGTQIIYQSPNPIAAIRELNDTLFIATADSSNYTFSYFSSGASVQQYASIPTDNFYSTFEILGQNDDHFYVRAKDSLNASFVSRINFQNPPELFLNGYFRYIDFIGNRFVIGNPGWSSNNNYIGLLSNPQQIDPIPAAQSIQTPLLSIDRYYGDGYYQIRSVENGIEFARLNVNDSIDLVQTNVFGPGSGIPVNVDGFNHYGDWTNTKFFIDDVGNLFTVLTNGNDGSYYMYQLNESVEKSLFKIDHPEDVTDIFVEDGYIYWSEIRDDGHSIKRRSLNDPLETQPTQVPQSETWFRQFVVNDNPSWDPYQVTMYLKDAKLNQDGSAIISLSMGEYLLECQFISSDSDSVMLMNGSDVVVKYDKYGQFLWANGIGQKYGPWVRENQFAVRENGNVVIFGRFYHDAIFDSDTIVNPNFETYTYLVELDANTGQIIWKKFIFQDTYWDTFEPEGMVIDENDNIYLAANFYGFGINIEGEYLSSDVNKTNALLKFDPTGNIIWARSCQTPFTDNFGETSSLSYSEEFQTISLCQSQANSVSWSSCEYQDWRYYIQEWDTDGNKKSGIEIVGSDVGSLTVSTRTANDQFFGMGYFRGTLAIDHYDVESTMGTSCHKTEAFEVIYDGDLNEIVSAKMTKNNAFRPLDIDNNGDFIYVLGTTASYALTILKYASNGDYIGYKPLNQILDPSDYDKGDASFDVKGEFILVEGKNFLPDTSLNVRPFVNVFQSLSILKTSNSGWIADDSWLQDAPYVFDNVDELLIYPNPFSNEINVYFTGTEVGYNSYQLVDINGRLIAKGNLSDIQLQTIQLPEMRQGIYLITFEGESGNITEQLMKL